MGAICEASVPGSSWVRAVCSVGRLGLADAVMVWCLARGACECPRLGVGKVFDQFEVKSEEDRQRVEMLMTKAVVNSLGAPLERGAGISRCDGIGVGVGDPPPLPCLCVEFGD